MPKYLQRQSKEHPADSEKDTPGNKKELVKNYSHYRLPEIHILCAYNNPQPTLETEDKCIFILDHPNSDTSFQEMKQLSGNKW